MLNPFAPQSDPIKPTSDAEESPTAPETTATTTTAIGTFQFWKRPALAATLLSRGPADDSSLSHSTSSVMFAEPELPDSSENGSRNGSVSDAGKHAPKPASKHKTSFSICHPPPAASLTRQKLHRRPRSLLQLHRLCPNARPVPAFEVVPSANFSVRLTRSITKVYKARHGLCPNDLVLLRAEENYSEDREDDQAPQDVLALICRGRKDDQQAPARAKICMSDGQEWDASPHLSGGYEFCTTDKHGLAVTVRWVPKRGKDARLPTGTRRFNFSTVSPNTRRHPVIAALTKTSLDINDSYRIPDPAGTTPKSTPRQKDSLLADAMEAEGLAGSDESATDDRLRDIITVTAIWVAFREGWSPTASKSSEDKDPSSRRVGSSASPRKDIFGSTITSTPPASPLPAPLEKRNSIRSVGSSMLRRSSLLTARADRNSTTSVESIASFDQAGSGGAGGAHQRSGRARSDSASTVLVHRAASNRRKNNSIGNGNGNNNSQATWRPDLLAAGHPVAEASREDLSPHTPRLKRLSTIESPGTPVNKKRTSIGTPVGKRASRRESRRSSTVVDKPGVADANANGEDRGDNESGAARMDKRPGEEEKTERDRKRERKDKKTKRTATAKTDADGDISSDGVKRESSTTTTNTSVSVSAAEPVPPISASSGATKKSARWKKIFCIR